MQASIALVLEENGDEIGRHDAEHKHGALNRFPNRLDLVALDGLFQDLVGYCRHGEQNGDANADSIVVLGLWRRLRKNNLEVSNGHVAERLDVDLRHGLVLKEITSQLCK